ncbi:alpha-enolase-like [Tupaia chinensis]|uniref:alpha-enolase-like n=1 Tax=Tupaia chinensis TaxID=246437 RepID=UPI0003C8F8E5|nr:alpha-enolase-like [Tupaia chinensis]
MASVMITRSLVFRTKNGMKHTNSNVLRGDSNQMQGINGLQARRNVEKPSMKPSVKLLREPEEGGFAPNIEENKEALELLKNAIRKAGYTDKVVLGTDVAASEFFRSRKYDLDIKSPDDFRRYITPEQLADLYKSFIMDYPVVSIKDPFDQDDWNTWQKFTATAGIQVVGDDLTVTNLKCIAKAVGEKSCNCLLLKVKQISSVTESLQACKLVLSNGRGVKVPHCSWETEVTFITDLVVGLCTGQIKTGATCWSELLAKYYQLLRIEEEVGSKTKFASRNFRNPLAMILLFIKMFLNTYGMKFRRCRNSVRMKTIFLVNMFWEEKALVHVEELERTLVSKASDGLCSQIQPCYEGNTTKTSSANKNVKKLRKLFKKPEGGAVVNANTPDSWLNCTTSKSRSRRMNEFVQGNGRS